MKNLLNTFIYLLGMAFLFQSCDQIYFTSPQPVDEENIKKFPEAIQGVYLDQNDSLFFGEDYFRSVGFANRKIPQIEADTSGNYILKDEKIYIIDIEEEIKVKGGFPYTRKNDTLYFSERTIMEIALGKKAFLRKVGDNYILNIKEEHEWYSLVFMELSGNGDLTARILNEKDLEKIQDFTRIYENNGDQYLKASWTNSVLNEHFQKGAFSDTLFHLEGSKKVSLKK